MKNENTLLNEKLKKRTNEIDTISRDLSHKSDIIRKLEQQLETLPILKNKVRELENALSMEALKTSEQSTLKSYNKSTRESDAFSKMMSNVMQRNDIFADYLLYRIQSPVKESQERTVSHFWESLNLKKAVKEKPVKKIEIKKTTIILNKSWPSRVFGENSLLPLSLDIQEI